MFQAGVLLFNPISKCNMLAWRGTSCLNYSEQKNSTRTNDVQTGKLICIVQEKYFYSNSVYYNYKKYLAHKGQTV